MFGTATKIQAYSGITLQRAKEINIRYKAKRATAMAVFNHAKNIKDNLKQRAALYHAKDIMKKANVFRARAKLMYKKAKGQLALAKRMLRGARRA